MKISILRILTLLTLTTLFLPQIYASEDTSNLVQMSAVIYKKDTKSYLAITFKNKEKWHTYWKNPGDAGLATEVSFYLNNEEEIFPLKLEWPVPELFIESEHLTTYGYKNTYALFYIIPNEYHDTLITIKAKWLVCKNICIPGKGTISGIWHEDSFDIKSGHSSPPPQDLLNQIFDNIPRKKATSDTLTLHLVKNGTNLKLQYEVESSNIAKQLSNHNILTPFSHPPLWI